MIRIPRTAMRTNPSTRNKKENDQQAEIYILWHANMFGKVQVSSGRVSK